MDKPLAFTFPSSGAEGLGHVDTYLIHKMMAASVTTAR
jgi:hypothetical protein